MGTASRQGDLANLWLVSACKQGHRLQRGWQKQLGWCVLSPQVVACRGRGGRHACHTALASPASSTLAGPLQEEGHQQAHTAPHNHTR